jgi:hypothetical protein
MNWFRNLKKWQKGGIIGLFIGALLWLCAFPLAYWILDKPFVSYIIIATHFIPAYYLSFGFLHSSFPFNTYYDYQFYLLLGPIMVFYGGVGAIVGLLQRTGDLLEKFLIAFILVLFLALFYFANIMVFFNFIPGEF